ncbi:MAG: class I tRNA ligase family protein, partial [Bacteroidaceae bacterium]|nr:class I tRNA ligase family protein [Bacteroidaceae bacterium]
MLAAPAGNDILFDEALCEQGRNFCNKIWNAFRLVKGWEVSDSIDNSEINASAVRWMNAKIKEVGAEIQDSFSKYRLSEALMAAFKLFTDEFSGWYLEMIKPAYQQPIDRKTLEATLDIFETLMKIIHPFMPFITEELWQAMCERKEGDSIMVHPLKLEALTEDEQQLLALYEHAKQVISGVRAVRNSKNIAQKEPLVLEVVKGNSNPSLLTLHSSLIKMANLSEIKSVEKKSEGSQSYLVGTQEYAVPLGNLIDADAEAQKAEAEIKRLEGFMAGIQKKLQNERFVQNAPAQVVELERKKVADAQSKIAALQETLKALSK